MSNRRDFLKNSLWATGAAVAVSACASTSSKPSFNLSDALSGPYYDLRKPEDNKEIYAKMVGDLDFSKDAPGWFSGYVSGVQDNKKSVDLVGFEGISHAKLLPQADGSYHKVLREVGFYTDLKTGEVLEEWDNPYTGETVKTVPVANDPFNQTIASYIQLPPSYGGLNEEGETKQPTKIPLILPWQQRGNQIHMERHIHLFYPNALQPEKWPRESAGKMVRVTEAFNHFIDPAEIQNRDSTKVKYTGTWSRTTPWLPWMLMGQTQGHCQYQCYMGGGQDLEQMVSRNVLDYVEKNHPKYMTAPGPEAWEKDSLSSIEMYALEQTPAPVK